MRADIEEIRQEEMAHLVASLIWLRMLILPVPVLVCLCFAIGEPSPWRWAILVAVPVAGVGRSIVDLLRQRSRRPVLPRFTAGLNIGVVFVPLVLLATGAVESPVLPALVVMPLLNVLLRPDSRASRVQILWLLAALWGIAGLELSGWPPALIPRLLGGQSRGAFFVLTATVITSTLMLLVFVTSRRIVVTHGAILKRAAGAQQELLSAYTEQNRLQSALSGEIAHEVKTPLASVKSLAALIARDLSGKSAERMEVLRREVDRIQSTLEEFLTFSRPLVPLCTEPVELRALCQAVAALFEGHAHPLTISAGEPVNVQGDPRKLRQVLINLLQNALEASPAASEVAMAVRAEGGRALVTVADRGPGLSPALGGREFEAGVSSKPNGSGLGLPIARALVQQHGGELSLRARQGGGCEAELALPFPGAAQ